MKVRIGFCVAARGMTLRRIAVRLAAAPAPPATGATILASALSSSRSQLVARFDFTYELKGAFILRGSDEAFPFYVLKNYMT